MQLRPFFGVSNSVKNQIFDLEGSKRDKIVSTFKKAIFGKIINNDRIETSVEEYREEIRSILVTTIPEVVGKKKGESRNKAWYDEK